MVYKGSINIREVLRRCDCVSINLLCYLPCNMGITSLGCMAQGTQCNRGRIRDVLGRVLFETYRSQLVRSKKQLPTGDGLTAYLVMMVVKTSGLLNLGAIGHLGEGLRIGAVLLEGAFVVLKGIVPVIIVQLTSHHGHLLGREMQNLSLWIAVITVSATRKKKMRRKSRKARREIQAKDETKF